MAGFARFLENHIHYDRSHFMTQTIKVQDVASDLISTDKSALSSSN